MSIAIEIGNGHGARGGIRRSPEFFTIEITVTIVEINGALAGITARVNHIIFAIAINVPNRHGCGAGRILQRTAIEMKLAVIEAYVAGHAAIRNGDIRKSVAVQITD